MKHAETIHKIITQKGFRIVCREIIILQAPTILGLYPYLRNKPKLLEITFQHLLNKVVEIGLVKKKNAIKDFAHLCGLDLNPKLCDPNSIRYRFYRGAPIRVGTRKYYANIIHRSKNDQEFVHNFLLFFGNEIL